MLTVSSPARIRYIFALLCVCSFAPFIRAQTTEADLESRLKDKPLYLRGRWRDNTLHFDPAGHLKGDSGPITFTLSGFELKKVHLKQDKLILEGRRVGLELTNNKQLRIPLNQTIHIDIAANPTGDYGPALDAIFVNSLADLVPALPFYWKTYASKNLLPTDKASALPTTSGATDASAQSQQPLPLAKPRSIGGGIKPPKLLYAADPGFSETARSLKHGGTTLLNLWVQPDGTVTNLSVVRAVGMGLDESALAAAQQYKFAPATENGKPVLVELNVEVNFQIY
jgi:TonB family protein